MGNTTPKLVTPEEFNIKLRSWTANTRSRMKSHAPVGSGKDWKGRESAKLDISVASRTKRYGLEIGKIAFLFEQHGVFVHYGVGRGYVRQGGSVIRGGEDKKGNRIASKSNGMNRKPNDWFDVEIKRGFNNLADITQEYYGDKAMENLLRELDKNKMLIQKNVD